MVSSLKLGNKAWDEGRLAWLFDQDSMKSIKEIFWTTSDQKDKLIWTKTKTEVFNVKLVNFLKEGGEHTG